MSATSDTLESTAEERPAGDGTPPSVGPIRRAWRATQRRWWSRWLVDLALIGLVITAVGWWQGRHLLASGNPAPEFALPALEDGKLHALADYRGKTVLLAFWAPWCSVCGLEASNLRAAHGWDDVEVVSVVLAYEDLESVREFVAEHELDFPVLLGNDKIQAAYAVNAFPTVYVIDEDGEIAHTVTGYTTQVGLRWRVGFF